MVLAPGAPAAPERLDDFPEPTWRLMLSRGLPQFAVEAVMPVLAFYAAWRAFGLGAGVAASTAVSLAIAAVIVRLGRDVALVALGVVFVLLQAAVALVSHSTTVYLAQPVVFSLLLAVVYVVSVVLGRP